MSRFSHFLLLAILFPAVSLAQSKLLTIEEATNMNPKLNAGSLSQLQWLPGVNRFVYVAKNSLVQGSPGQNSRDTILRLNEVNTILKYNNQDTLKRFPVITFLTADTFYFTNTNKLFHCDILKNTVNEVNSWKENAENMDIDESGNLVAYTVENNLIISMEGREIAVTEETNKGIVYGSNRVHRNEFGIEKGTFWSPDGKYLAFYRMDETMVAEYPLVDITPRIATMTPTRYPMAGMTSHKVSVGIYSIASGKITYLHTDSAPGTDSALLTEYLTNITWSPDRKFIYIATLNRDQNFMQLNKYHALSGLFVKTLFEEKNNTYVEPLQGPKFLTGDPGKFIWESRRDGFNHLYLYDTEGNLIKQLTKGPWEVTGFVKSDASGIKAWFYCNKGNPLERHLYIVDLKNGNTSPVTITPGMHTVKISDDGRYILDNYTSASTARQIELLDAKGGSVQTLLANDNPLKDYQLGVMSVFTLKSEDNSDLYCRLIKPVNFDKEKKYPVIIYTYGGPHSQLITNSWLGGAGLFLNYLAGQGYVVFTLDNRGTANRGRDFEQAIFRNLGIKEVNDQMVGVNYLKSLPFVDSTRIGINGWSYGGFLTISMVLKHPGVFKVAVCGGPVIDWKYYEVMYGERYMDTPESNPDGYKNACLTNYVKDLKGKLLIIHDDQDGTVVPQNSLTFLKKCVDEGKQVDFFVYPGHEHNVRGKDRVHLNQKMVMYFQENL
ncbi:MAG: DPP IV N-terminal domain-containing protein [Bacteroidales bacterium]|nr:DPP IV N-terminal domain-containing protein [Bacteroidales bacterium]